MLKAQATEWEAQASLLRELPLCPLLRRFVDMYFFPAEVEILVAALERRLCLQLLQLEAEWFLPVAGEIRLAVVGRKL